MPLGKDLAAIRAQQNLSIEDIHDATRIPFNTIQEIESETIFYDDHRNTTYMRSFVRTYAKALKIDDDDAVQALDQMADDTYSGLIRKKYGDQNTPAKSSTPDSKQSSTEKTTKISSSTGRKTSTSASAPSQQKSETKKEESGASKEKAITDNKEKRTESSAQKKKSSKKTRYAGETKTSVPPSPKRPTEGGDVPDVKSINWADTGRKMYTFRNNKKYIYGSVIFLFIVIFGGYLLFRGVDEPVQDTEVLTGNLPEEEGILPETPIDTAGSVSFQSNTDGLSPDEANIDSAQAQQMVDDSPTQNQIQPAQTSNGVLPDTLQLIVYASNDKLEPVRVMSDLVDGYSPYWIEQGVAMRFQFTSEIHVRGQYTRMALFVNGNFMENFRDYRGDENQIHITRELLEEDPQLWLPQGLSTGGTDIVLPDTVISRPTF